MCTYQKKYSHNYEISRHLSRLFTVNVMYCCLTAISRLRITDFKSIYFWHQYTVLK